MVKAATSNLVLGVMLAYLPAYSLFKAKGVTARSQHGMCSTSFATISTCLGRYRARQDKAVSAADEHLLLVSREH